MERWQAVEATVLEFQSRPFEYGPADCGAFLCAYMKRAGIAIPVRVPTRTTPNGAARALRSLGVETMADLIDAHFERCAPLQTRVGDLAAVPSDIDGDPACGIVGNGCVHALNRSGGVMEMPRRLALKAWRV